MKKLYSLFIGMVAFSAVNAQVITELAPTVFASAGNYATSPTMTLSYTIGEPITETLFNIKLVLTQGFQQPEGFTIGVQEIATNFGNVKVFPNPFNDNLTIEVNTDKNHELYLYIYDVLGQQIESGYLANHLAGKQQYTVSTANLAQGMYTLTIATKSGDFIKTVKVNKIN